jgi:hypothetical protein
VTRASGVDPRNCPVYSTNWRRGCSRHGGSVLTPMTCTGP